MNKSNIRPTKKTPNLTKHNFEYNFESDKYLLLLTL